MSDDVYRVKMDLTGLSPREIDSDAVAALDRAMQKVGGEPMHAIDPTRIKQFADGGPPVWSVGVSAVPNIGFLYVTYGLSRAVEPASPFSFELSILVADSQMQMWPTLLLRQLARYQLMSGRELRAGDPMDFGQPMTQVAMGQQHGAAELATGLTAIGIAPDPMLRGVGEPAEVRRVVGLYPDELQMAEVWSTAGFLQSLASIDPYLTTHLTRPSMASNEQVIARVQQGAVAEGSQTPAIVVPGVRWQRLPDNSYEVRIPGHTAQRVIRLAKARLPFGRNLMLHDFDPLPGSEIGLEPASAPGLAEHGNMLVLKMPPNAGHFAFVPNGEDIVWRFS